MAKSEGKYASVLPGLPKAQPTDLAFQEKVDAFKRTVEDRDAFTLAEEYAILRRGHDARLSPDKANELMLRLGKDGLKDLLAKCQVWVSAYEQLLAESQEAKAEGWGAYGVKENAIRLPSGETIRVHQEPQGKVVDKEAFRRWCIFNGYERQLQLWPSTMNAIVKERLLKGEPEPDGTEATSYTEVRFVKAGGRDEE